MYLNFSLLFLATMPRDVFAVDDKNEEFSNNLVSDLAPFLALFGERVAQQFMSQSMGWADIILFAMAPLGVVAALVGAIRVGGPTGLKTVIGRAREARSMAEQELMSSTSPDVCEMWNGRAIVRLTDSPPIKQFIHLCESTEPGEIVLYTLEEARRKRKLVEGNVNCLSVRSFRDCALIG